MHKVNKEATTTCPMVISSRDNEGQVKGTDEGPSNNEDSVEIEGNTKAQENISSQEKGETGKEIERETKNKEKRAVKGKAITDVAERKLRNKRAREG
ncbi:hypothetical protein V2J09_017999 [Rumex salicifolius]